MTTSTIPTLPSVRPWTGRILGVLAVLLLILLALVGR